MSLDFLSQTDSLSRYLLRYGGLLRFVLIGVVGAIAAVLSPGEGIAQVIEDQSLGGENTSVRLDGKTYEISGGSIRGADAELLFHSFDSFSLEEGQTAQFSPDDNITTIFSRVTGGKPSEINGTIASDTVDLFLLNPAGVVFGPESAIEIGGSIMISTAESLTFADGGEFSSLSPQPAPLLTVSQPIGLSFGETSRGIEIGIEGDFSPLNVDRALFAGNGIRLTGIVIVPSGQVELASLAPGSSIELAPSDESLVSRFDIDSENFSEFALSDIDLVAGVVDTNSVDLDSPSGRIVLAGRQIQLREDSELFSRNFSRLPGEGISILASANLSVDGALILSDTFRTGDGGNILLTSADLIANGALISTDTFGTGAGGNLLLEANGSIALLDGSRLRSQSRETATGAAGALTIRAQQLSIQEGSSVSTSALGNGLGGTLFVDVPDGTVEISGVVPVPNGDPRLSQLISNTSGVQDSGRIQINTENLIVRSGGQIESRPVAMAGGDSGGITVNATESIVVSGESNTISSAITTSNSSSSPGDSGPISLTTGRLLISDGGRIFSSTNGAGQGGDLIIQAEEVVLSGSGADSNKLFGLFARTEGSGDSGRLDLTTESLVIRDGARLTVSTDDDAAVEELDVEDLGVEELGVEELGAVRDAEINARQIVLDNGRITAESLSGNGGILSFNVQDFLLLRNNSLISATAGTAAAGGDGGNINIVAPTGFVIAVPGEDSDIIANAFLGMGGNVNITTQSILGLEARQAIAGNTTNDIDASSEFGTAGTILFNNLELDPTEGVIELPTEAVAPGQVAQRCLADSEGRNAFVVTGQGGAPPSPIDVIRNENSPRNLSDSLDSSSLSDTSDSDTSMAEAIGWQRNSEGAVVLVALDSATAQANSAHYHSCISGEKR